MTLAELQSKVNREDFAKSLEQQMQVLIGRKVNKWRTRYDQTLYSAAGSDYAGELSQIENIKRTTKNPKLIRPGLLWQITKSLEFKNNFELIFGDRREMNSLVSFFSFVLLQLAKEEGKPTSDSWQGTTSSFRDLYTSTRLLTRTGALKQAILDFNLLKMEWGEPVGVKLFDRVLTVSQFNDIDRILLNADREEKVISSSHIFSWDLYELLEQRFGAIEDMNHLGRDLADWFLDVWVPHMIEKLEWYHADPVTSTGKNIYQVLERLVALHNQQVMIANTPVTEMLVSSETAEKNKLHAITYIEQKRQYEAIYFYHLVMQDDYFDKSQDSEDTMTYLELTEHEALRELLPTHVGTWQYKFMYSNYDIDRAKQDWEKIVERIEKVTQIRAENDEKYKGKAKDRRQRWAKVHMPKLPEKREE